MRSTPIILDRLRHIKYDLQAVWDMDYLMEGDFTEILNKEITFDFVQFLLWSGLISEDPHLTMKDAGRLLLDAIDKKHGTLQDITMVCINELLESGWVPRPADEDELVPAQDTEMVLTPDSPEPAPQTINDYILSLVAMAESSGMLDSQQIWKHTPRELADLKRTVAERDRVRELAADYRMGTICTMILRSQGMKWDTGKDPVWLDFVPHEQKPQTADEMQNIIRAANAGIGGTVK